MTIEEFCDKHCACPEGREWALETCKDMQEAWDTAKPEWVVWMATRPGVLTGSEARRFAVWCARWCAHLLVDQQSFDAITAAERYANGNVKIGELAAANLAARHCPAANLAARHCPALRSDTLAFHDRDGGGPPPGYDAHMYSAIVEASVAAYGAAELDDVRAAQLSARAAGCAAYWESLRGQTGATIKLSKSPAWLAAVAAQAAYLKESTNPKF